MRRFGAAMIAAAPDCLFPIFTPGLTTTVLANSSSYEYSRPASTVLEEALLSAKRSLQKARGFLTTGFDESEDILKVAGTVADLADDIYCEMERKIDGKSRNRSRR